MLPTCPCACSPWFLAVCAGEHPNTVAAAKTAAPTIPSCFMDSNLLVRSYDRETNRAGSVALDHPRDCGGEKCLPLLRRSASRRDQKGGVNSSQEFLNAGAIRVSRGVG